ncbi:hypothetical protein [Pontibacter ruber]|nr:hypothetical protein [Pontibacter ruber]
MKTTETRLLQKWGLLLTFFLCSLAALAMPVVTETAASEAVRQAYLADNDPAPFTLSAGEITAGTPQAVLQLHKDLYTPQLQPSLQPQYTRHFISEAIPAFCNFFSCESALHSILTKGP